MKGCPDPQGIETVLEITHAPGVPPGELLETLRAIYPREKEALGVVALEIAPG